MTNFL